MARFCCIFRSRPRPRPARSIPIAPGVLWLRMRLPFALDHINLWLIEDGPGWTRRYRLCPARDARRLAAHLRRASRRQADARVIVTHFHPDHIGMAGWLTERWQAPLWITDKEWLHARMKTGRRRGRRPAAPRFRAPRRARRRSQPIFAERQGNYRRGVPSVPPAYHRIGEGTSSRSAGGTGGS